MSIWHVLFEGMADGFRAAAAYRELAPPHGNDVCERGRVQRLCRQLGWSVDERDGSVIYPHFSKPGGGVRKVRITNGDDAVATFSAFSLAVLPAPKVPGDLLASLLCRNLSGSGIGTWGMYVADDGDVTFHVLYPALASGLDAEAFKRICQSLAGEVADLDGKLREPGCCGSFSRTLSTGDAGR